MIPEVSDHAIVRYLERVKGLDIKAIKEEIAPQHVRNQIRALGSGYYPVDGKFKIRVKNGVVITVLMPKMSINQNMSCKGWTTRNKALRKAELMKQKRLTDSVREAEQWEEAGL